jgi:nucleoside-diphosphate-sugar epimerase
MIRQLAILLAIASSTVTYISVVTGASGFVGWHVAYSLLRQHDLDDDDGDGGRHEDVPYERTIVCLVRPEKVLHEKSYWNAHVTDMRQLSRDKVCVKVMPYDMLDGGLTLNDDLEASIKENDSSSPSSSRPICIYHVASVFGPTPDPIRTAKDNVRSVEDVVRTIDEFHRRHPRPRRRPFFPGLLPQLCHPGLLLRLCGQ